MKDILIKLTEYTFALKDALERTNESSERPNITKHLAAAAEMYALLYKHETIEAIDHIVHAECRSYSRSNLSGELGENVEKKWGSFIDATGIGL